MPTLHWIGKEKVINHHQDVPFRVLEEQYTYGSETSENKIIHGDNLEALKALLPEYEGKIKCIYIDPPYNTGNEGWVYNDKVNDPKIKKWLGEVVGKESEDLSRHDKWLCMMYPRLKLLHKLLAEDGVLFISIDENEQENLVHVINEIFGKRNQDMLIWQKTDPWVDRNTNAKKVSRFLEFKEYVLIAYKNKKDTQFEKIYKLPDWKNSQKNVDKDPRGNWQSGIFSYEENHKNEDRNSESYFTIITPSGKEYTRHWFVACKDEYEKLNEERMLYFGKDGNSAPRLKVFENIEKKYYMNSILRGFGTSSTAKDEISEIFGDRKLFDTPKPSKLITELIRSASKKDSIILDSFAGSGTTAHAVLNLNKQDCGNRKFILIEMEDYAETITAERVKRVIGGYGDDEKRVDGTGGDFSYYTLGDTLFNSDGLINKNISISELRKYIYFMETKKQIVENSAMPSFLGIHNDVSYYFYYDESADTVLNHEFLSTIQEKTDAYIIYADACMLSEQELDKYNITFKKIPRDIIKL